MQTTTKFTLQTLIAAAVLFFTSNSFAITCSDYLHALDVINDNYATTTEKNQVNRLRLKALESADDEFFSEADDEQQGLMQIINGSHFKAKRYLNIINSCEDNLNKSFKRIAYKADKALVERIMKMKGYATCQDVGKKDLDFGSINRMGYSLLGSYPVYTKNGQFFESKYNHDPIDLTADDFTNIMVEECKSYKDETPLFLALKGGFKAYKQEMKDRLKKINDNYDLIYKELEFRTAVKPSGKKLVKDLESIVGYDKSKRVKYKLMGMKQDIHDDMMSLAKNIASDNLDKNKELLDENGKLKSLVTLFSYVESRRKHLPELNRLNEEYYSLMRVEPENSAERKLKIEEFYKEHFEM